MCFGQILHLPAVNTLPKHHCRSMGMALKLFRRNKNNLSSLKNIKLLKHSCKQSHYCFQNQWPQILHLNHQQAIKVVSVQY